MSITATVNLATSPPRVQVIASSSDGSAITAISVTRTAQGTTEALASQPAPGPSPRTVNDYLAPWGTNLYYTATVVSAAGTEVFTSTPVILSPAVAWLIHPLAPALSMILDSGTFLAMGVVSIGTVSRPAMTTPHDIIGAKYRTISKTGPRAAPRTSLTIATVTPAERDGLSALLEDQTPLLIRVPSAWLWDWEDGYYDVGAVDFERFMQYGPERRRVVTLPLERVEAPAGTQEPERSYADVLATFSTYAALAAAYGSYTDLLTDTRR